MSESSIKLQDKYTKDQFEEKIFPYCMGVGLLLMVLYVVAGCIEPWLFLFIPLGICCLFILVAVGSLIAMFLSDCVRWVIELVTGRDFT